MGRNTQVQNPSDIKKDAWDGGQELGVGAQCYRQFQRPGLVHCNSICSVMFIDFTVFSIGREVGR